MGCNQMATWITYSTLLALIVVLAHCQLDFVHLCNRVKSQNYINNPPIQIDIQAITVYHKYLYIIESNLLYKIPRDRIRDEKIFILDIKTDTLIQPIEWIRETSLIFQNPQKMRELGKLRRLTIFPVDDSVHYIQYIFEVVTILVRFTKNSNSIKIVYTKKRGKHYFTSVSDGFRNGYLFQIDSKHDDHLDHSDHKVGLPRIAILPLFTGLNHELSYLVDEHNSNQSFALHYHLVNSIHYNQIVLMPNTNLRPYLMQKELLSHLPQGFIQNNQTYLFSVDRARVYIIDFVSLDNAFANKTIADYDEGEFGDEIELTLNGSRFREIFVCDQRQVEKMEPKPKRVFNYRVPLAAYLGVAATLLSVISVMGGIVIARKIIENSSDNRLESSICRTVSIIDSINQMNRRAKRRMSFEPMTPHSFDSNFPNRVKLKLTIV